MRPTFRPGLQALRTIDSKSPLHPDNMIPYGFPREQVAELAGLDFEIGEAPALMMDPETGILREFPDRKMLFRKDSRMPLSIVGADYHITQPSAMLQTFDAFADVAGFRISAAGAIKGGRRIWAMAETGEAFSLADGDTLAGYLYMATACDTTMASTGFFTSIAATCWNMLQRMWEEAQRRGMFFKIPHSTEFNVAEIQKQMLAGSAGWGTFTEQAKALSQRQVSDREAIEFLIKVLGKWDETKEVDENVTEQEDARNVAKVIELFQGKAMGADLKSRQGTVWGLVNATTEFLDHHRPARSAENRFASATMGDSFDRKSLAWTEALKLAA